MNNDSLADRAVTALSMVRAMTEGVSNEQPERHALRGMKRCAERVLADAFEVAIGIAYEAQSMTDLAKDLTARERERCALLCDDLGGDIDESDPDPVKLAANSLVQAIRRA